MGFPFSYTKAMVLKTWVWFTCQVASVYSKHEGGGKISGVLSPGLKCALPPWLKILNLDLVFLQTSRGGSPMKTHTALQGGAP